MTKPVERKMGIKELMVNLGEQTPHFLKSLMHYYGVITHFDATSIQIPNKLVREQFFLKLSLLTQSFIGGVTHFVYGGDTKALQAVLVQFSKNCFSVLDDATEPSLKARLIGLLYAANIEEDFNLNIASEREFGLVDGKEKGKKRVDYYLEPKKLNLKSRLVEVKSVPHYWLDVRQFNEYKWIPTVNKKVGELLADMSKDNLLNLQLDKNIWFVKEKKFNTVRDYIEAGRQQLQEYIHIVDKEVGQLPCGYLVWSVGMRAIHVEEVHQIKVEENLVVI